MVYGPPCAGKTSYVAARAGSFDTVIDFDAIAVALGSPSQHDHPSEIIAAAKDQRLRMINEALGSDKGRAWIIQSFLSEDDRTRFKASGADFVLLDPGAAVVTARAKDDARPDWTIAVIERWYRDNTKDEPMTGLDVKFAGVQPDALEENGTIKGYASLFGVRDQGGDVVMPGAYAESLAERGRVPMLWQHDPAVPIGQWTVMREDEKGLYVEGRLSLKTQRGLEAYEMLKDGIIRGLSIGYRVERSKKTAAGRELWKVALWEVSLVTFPMQVEAAVGDVKGIEDGNFAAFKRNVEKFARDAGFSAAEAKAAAAGAVERLSSARDAAEKPSAASVADMIRQIATS